MSAVLRSSARALRGCYGDMCAECRAAAGRDVGADEVAVVTAALWSALHGTVSTIIADRLDRRLDRERVVDGAVRFALAGVLA